MSTKTAIIIARWIIGVCLVLEAAVYLVKAAGVSTGGYATATTYALVAFGLGITGLLLMAPEMVPWLSAPVWRFITGIVFPDDKYNAPPVNYALPRSYHRRLRHEDAIEEYFKIIRYHPQEQVAYVECIKVMLCIDDLQGARKVLAEGLRKLRTREARGQLLEAVRILNEGGVLRVSIRQE
ncbi:MAG: hypothetical protein ACAH88_10130 [Roseimicrobium sp.]